MDANENMKLWQYITTLSTGACAFILALALILIASSNKETSAKLQKQQEVINRGMQSHQVMIALAKDMGGAALNNSKMKELLAKNGFTVTQNANQEKK